MYRPSVAPRGSCSLVPKAGSVAPRAVVTASAGVAPSFTASPVYGMHGERVADRAGGRWYTIAMADEDRRGEVDALVRDARVEQSDPIAEMMRSNVRRKLLGKNAAAPKIGRFTVLETIGAGAMGTVVAAYDPVLDRKVALKLLREGATT